MGMSISLLMPDNLLDLIVREGSISDGTSHAGDYLPTDHDGCDIDGEFLMSGLSADFLVTWGCILSIFIPTRPAGW